MVKLLTALVFRTLFTQMPTILYTCNLYQKSRQKKAAPIRIPPAVLFKADLSDSGCQPNSMQSEFHTRQQRIRQCTPEKFSIAAG